MCLSQFNGIIAMFYSAIGIALVISNLYIYILFRLQPYKSGIWHFQIDFISSGSFCVFFCFPKSETAFCFLDTHTSTTAHQTSPLSTHIFFNFPQKEAQPNIQLLCTFVHSEKWKLLLENCCQRSEITTLTACETHNGISTESIEVVRHGHESKSNNQQQCANIRINS